MNRFYRENIHKWLFGNQRGTTLIEMTTVVAVLGILSAITAPNFARWTIEREINGASQKLYFDLQLARASAVKNNNNVVFTFITNAPIGYSILDDTNNDGLVSAGETLKTIAVNTRVNYGYNGTIVDMDGNNVTASVFLAGGGAAITFFPNGESDRSGSAYLIHSGDVGQNNNRLQAVSVVQATGAIDHWLYNAANNPPWD